MPGIEVRSPESPDEIRPFEKNGQVQVMEIAGRGASRAIFEPGWKWSNDVKPIAGTDSCQVEHFGYCLEGHMTVKMDDGSEAEIEQGQFFSIPPGHDAWVDDSRCVLLDFAQSKEYAKRS